MKLALIGLANSGRTTLLNALAGLSLETQPYPTTEGEPHRAIVKVPDARIDELARIYSPKKTTYATVEYADFMGLIKGDAAQNRRVFEFFKDADALVHVVRAFPDEGVLHPLETVDALRDFNAVEEELILADLELVEKRLERMEEGRKKGKPPDEGERRILLRCKEILDAEQPLRHTVLTAEELKATAHLQFVSAKPLLPVVNVAEGDLAGPRREALGAGVRGAARALPGAQPADAALSLGEDRGGDRAAAPRGGRGVPRGPRHRRVGARRAHPRLLRAARADLVPHRRRGRGARLDDPARAQRRRRRRGRSTRTSSAASSGPRRWATTTS